MFLMGLFGFQAAILYLIITVALGILLSSILTSFGEHREIFRGSFAIEPEASNCACGEPSETESQDGISISCCDENDNTVSSKDSETAKEEVSCCESSSNNNY